MGGRWRRPLRCKVEDHLLASTWVAVGVDLYDAKSKEEYHQLIREYAKANPDEEFVLGIGWTDAVYGGKPTAAELDELVPDRPAILLDFTIHDAWLNTRAMAAGGITKDTVDPVPGVTYWVRDDDGNPLGSAIEFAWMSTYVKSGAWQPERMIRDGQQENHQAAIEAGITAYLNPGVVTPNVTETEGMFADYAITMQYLADLDAKGELKLRTFVQPAVKSPDVNAKDFARRAKEYSEKYNTDRLRSLGIKVHPEGNWTSRTSWMLEDYEGLPGNRGAASVEGELLKQVVLEGNALGLDVATHTDGSQTVRNMIDAIEASRKAGNHDERNSLHHLFWVDPADYPRIVKMKLPVNVTPIFTTDFTESAELALNLLGKKRVDEQLSVYPKLFDAGNKVSLSADIPSSPLEYIAPLFSVQSAMTLANPADPNSKTFPPGRKGITLKQGIEGITINAAWQLRMEDKIGTLEVGKYADLVILEKNLFDIDTHDIADVKVMGAMMGGKFTYRDGI
jgi:predicted amidohydrolase YtcJ